MKTSTVFVLVVLLGGLIVVGTMHKPQPNPQVVAARKNLKKATENLCRVAAKPFSTTVSYDQPMVVQQENGFKACMKENGIEGYEDAPMPVKQ